MAESESREIGTAWLVEEWTRCLGEAVEGMGDQRPAFKVQPPSGRLAEWCAQAAARGPLLWWRQPLSLGPQALIAVGAPSEAWLELGARTLRAAGIETVEEGESRSTYLEVVGQSLAGLARALSARLQSEVVCGPGVEGAEFPEPADFRIVELAYSGVVLAPVALAWNAALAESLAQAAEGPAEMAPEPEPDLEPAGTSRQPPGAAEAVLRSRTLERLLEVELPVSVSFGHVELPLKEVLKLTTGSIVELDRAVNEPVEVIVNNCVIARGEVVVVEGNYGVRILQIVSRQQRLSSLP